MSRLTPEGRAALARIAEPLGFPVDAAEAMLDALVAGGGGMAQFDHPALGGRGQWMRGGMVMTGDFLDHATKARVDRLATALSDVLANEPSFAGGSFQRQSQTSGGLESTRRTQDSRDALRAWLAPSAGADAPSARGDWWPPELGAPDAAGAQDDVRYAWFAAPRRLAVDRHGRTTVYDTGEHRIHGIAQQQNAFSDLDFSSQLGSVDLQELPIVDAIPMPGRPGHPGGPRPVWKHDPHDPFVALERLSALHAQGVVSDAEFQEKKAELLKRI